MSEEFDSYTKKSYIPAIIIAALGYFVDIYDLILFGVIRVQSLEALGFVGNANTVYGEWLISIQMFGMLLGGILWGVLGDKKGRLSVLFGSILMYSIANLLNGFVNTIESYAFWRFIAGIGLAGELGAGITLVSELMPKETRGYGATIIAGFGLLGGITAGLIGNYEWNIGSLENWRIAYVIGGVMGLALLILRIGVQESGIFEKFKHDHNVKKGDFLSLFTDRNKLIKYIQCITVGVPTWVAVGILILFAPEFAKVLHIEVPDGEKVKAGTAVMMAYAGLATGDVFSGVISQMLKSRKKAVAFFIILTVVFSSLYLFSPNVTLQSFYLFCYLIGFGAGFWAIFVTIASENFGTNIRATATTTIPNFVRGSVTLILPIYNFFSYLTGSIIYGAFMVTLIFAALALLSLSQMEETFHNDLNFVE
jgi:MFS family permease